MGPEFAGTSRTSLLHYGTHEARRSRRINTAAGGNKAYRRCVLRCFTGPTPDQDAGSIPTSGLVCTGGTEGRESPGHFALHGDVTSRSARVGDDPTVWRSSSMIRTHAGRRGRKTSVYRWQLIPTSHQGVNIGPPHRQLQCLFMNGRTGARTGIS